MTILRITSDIPRYTEDYNFSNATFNIQPLIGGFDNELSDSLKLIKTPYSPNKGDKIYFLPHVSIPRVKFKNVSIEYGIKTIRDIEQANVIFGCKKSINDIFQTMWLYKCKTEDFKAFIKMYESQIDDYYLEKIETALEFYDNKYVAIDYSLSDWVSTVLPNIEHFRYSERLSIVKEEYLNIYNIIKDKEILDESSVINVLNGEDATEIDKVMFEHLSDMFESSDNDNHVLAMEIMANSKYVESLIYLELLFYKYSYVIGNTSSKNHVNFKSLISYLGKDYRHLTTDIDNILVSLKDKDQLTPDKLDILLSYTHKDIEQRGNTQYFTVKTISVKPDILAELNSNYTYSIQEDFVPTVEESLVDVEEEITTQVEAVTEEPESEFATEDNFEVASEEEISHMLYGVDNENIEVSLTLEDEEEDTTDVLEPGTNLEISESKSNNNQIEETNGKDDFDWF